MNVADRVRAAVNSVENGVVDRFIRPAWTPAEIGDLRGKVALVTGANSGLGFETTKRLADNGCKVLMVSRNLQKGLDAAARLRAALGKQAGPLEVLQCDFMALNNVVELTRAVLATGEHLDLVVCMAGVFYPGPYKKTEDGIEQTLQVNYYAHALLTLGLLDRLRSTPGSRIIMMVSGFEFLTGKIEWGNMRGEHYTDSGAVPYGSSKAMKAMFARELSTRVLEEVDCFCVHPGLVMSPLHRKSSAGYPLNILIKMFTPIFGQYPSRGSHSTLYAATEPSLAGTHFGYFAPNLVNYDMVRARRPGNPAIRNAAACWRLFEETLEVLRAAVGPKNVPLPPEHPNWLWSK